MGSTALRQNPGERILLLVVLNVMAMGFSLARVDAAPTDVALSPSSGAVGTEVTVTGSGCSPGLIFNPSRVRVLGATLGVNVDMAVSAGGAWSVVFLVPADAAAGPHAIAVTCVKDLVPVPYVPLTFTVTTAPSSTLDPTTTVPAVVPSTLPSVTTTARALDSSTTTIDPAQPPAGEGGGVDENGSTPRGAAPTTLRSEVSVTEVSVDVPTGPATTSSTRGAPVVVDEIAVARVDKGGGRSSFALGALSPIGDGWLGLVMGSLVGLLIVSGAVAATWFGWLRHTRAQQWWLRWMNQIVHIRSHARLRR